MRGSRVKTGSSLSRVEVIEEEIIDIPEDHDEVTALTTSEEDQSRMELESGERKQFPYFKVISPVPSLSVSSLKADSPHSIGRDQGLTSEEEDGGQGLTSEEDDREFEETLNNSLQSNTTESPDISNQRFVLIYSIISQTSSHSSQLASSA